jgi:sortase A
LGRFGHQAPAVAAATQPGRRYRGAVVSRVVGWIGRIFVVAGLFLLGFVAFQLWGTALEEQRGQSQLAGDLSATLATVPGAEVPTSADPAAVAAAMSRVDPVTAPPLAPPPEGEPLGIIEMPSIDVARMMVAGVNKADLRKGPGHYPGTPLPGQPGNSGIAGHRTTYGAPFNRIDELVPGDEIIVSTVQGRFVYQVVPAPGSDRAWFVVDPSDVSVLDPTGDNRITLTACHPEYSARQRIIVQAVLVGPAATPAPPDQQAPATPGAATGTGGEAPDAGDPAGEVAASADIDSTLGGDPDALLPTIAWGALAAAVLLLAGFVARRWRRLPTYLVAAPLVLVPVWMCWTYLDRWLPAL